MTAVLLVSQTAAAMAAWRVVTMAFCLAAPSVAYLAFLKAAPKAAALAVLKAVKMADETAGSKAQRTVQMMGTKRAHSMAVHWAQTKGETKAARKDALSVVAKVGQKGA